MSESEESRSEQEPAVHEPEAGLERMYLEAYLRGKGHTLKSAKALPESEARQLLAEASAYASARLAEVETRARLVRDIHDSGQSLDQR